MSIASLVGIAFATLQPQAPGVIESHVCLVCGSLGTVDAVLNVLLFAPLGIGLALYGLRGKSVVIAICVLSAAIEIIQFLFVPGRDSTIGDVITNTVGGAVGVAVVRYAAVWLRPGPRAATRLAAIFATMWLTVQAISSFGFVVSLPPLLYYGQIARALGHFAVFSGLVVGAQVGEARLVDAPLENSAQVRYELLRGADVATRIVAGAPPNGIAPIVRVVDPRGREIVVLAQEGRDLLFGVRTGAASLRLRQPYFALGQVVGSAESDALARDDTLTLSASYDSKGVALTAERDHAKYRKHIPITSSLGWVMLMPFPWAVRGTPWEAALGMIWIALLLFPVAYWGSTSVLSSQSATPRRLLGVAASASLVLYIGLFVIPHIFGIRAASVRDWLAALTAIVGGVGLALAVRGGRSNLRNVEAPSSGLQ